MPSAGSTIWPTQSGPAEVMLVLRGEGREGRNAGIFLEFIVLKEKRD